MTVSSTPDPDGFTGTHVQVKSLIIEAYGVNWYQIFGGPDWASSDLYDLKAKMDEPTMEALHALPPDQQEKARQHMMQALLADRFKLVVHHETKQYPIYSLIVAKGGPKLHASDPKDDYKNGLKSADGEPGGKGMMWMSSDSNGFVIQAQALSMDRLAAQLSGDLQSKVQNNTGLKGDFDFTLRYSPNVVGVSSTSISASPTIFAALQDQLGLKLESQKGPLDVIVIDHIERPSEN